MQPIDLSYVPILIGTGAAVVAFAPERWTKRIFVGAVAGFPLLLCAWEFLSIQASGGVGAAIGALFFTFGMILFLWCMPVLIGFVVGMGLKLAYAVAKDRLRS